MAPKSKANLIRTADDYDIDPIDGQLTKKPEKTPFEVQPAELTTDLGNAERLAKYFGDRLHYCYERKRWLIWTGKVWEWDSGAKIAAVAKATVRKIYHEAGNDPNEKRRKELADHAKRSESDNRINAMINLAQSEQGIPVKVTDLDTDPWLFNCLNGMIDLRTGQLLPHRKDDLVTVLVPIEYHPEEQCQLWLSFLNKITAGDAELQTYLQRAVGYSLTAETTEQCFFFLWGLGLNGKTTFLETIKRMAGDYGATIATEALMTKKHYTSGPKESLANLKGKRFIVASEVQEGRWLNVGQIKDLTGSDSITADRKFEHEIEFFPTHKLWIRGNHKPVITETTLAIWRRVKLVPFTVTIPLDQIDKQLPVKLQQELSGILAWAIKGCLDWQANELAEPMVVKVATSKYQQESDILNDFLEDCCILEPTTVLKKELRNAYKDWCEANNQDVVSQITFKARLIERGITEDRVHRGNRIWRGIRLLSEGDKVTRVTGNSHKPYMRDSLDINSQNSVTPVTPKLKGDKTPEILTFWESLGRPLIHLGPGENCEDLTKLLSGPDILPRHFEAVKNWAQENGWTPEKEGKMQEV